APKKWHPGIDQRRQLTRKNHQDLWLNLFALEKNNAGFPARPRRPVDFPRATARFFSCFSVRTSFSLFVDTRREITALTQLADCFIGGTGFKHSGRFLSSSVESDVVITRHKKSLTHKDDNALKTAVEFFGGDAMYILILPRLCNRPRKCSQNHPGEG